MGLVQQGLVWCCYCLGKGSPMVLWELWHCLTNDLLIDTILLVLFNGLNDLLSRVIDGLINRWLTNIILWYLWYYHLLLLLVWYQLVDWKSVSD